MKATTTFIHWSLLLVGSALLASCVEAGDTVVDPAEVNGADDDEGDEPVRRNDLQPSEEDECGDVSEEGQCNGALLEHCVDGEVETVDCTETDASCGISLEGEAACLSCDEVNDIGFCVGEIATFCEDGVVSSVDCAARDQVCARPDAYATCVDEGTPSNCDAISSAGACNGDELIQCTRGELEFIDCGESGDGYSCGMHEDGYAACLSCEEVDATGFCVGDIYSYCEDGEVRTGDCSETGEVCQATDEGFRCGDPEAAPEPEPEPEPDLGDQCAAESDCGGCCQDAHASGAAQYSAEVTRCSCVACADECEEICVDGASSASDTCVSCASQCVSDGSCLGDEDCAGYLACLATCPATSTEPEPEPEPEATGSIGAACGASDDCGADLSCNAAEDGYFGASYPNGLCTLDCAADPFACPSGTQCLGSGSEAYCAPECPTGDVSGPKCRSDQVCVPTSETVGICDAWCRDDDDCPGQVCDVWTGLCTGASSAGEQVGASCAMDEECAGGVCLFWSDTATTGACSSACRLGEAPSPCNGGEGPGVCDPVTTMLGFGLAASPGEGDLGLCAPGCETDEDCLAEGLVCVTLLEEFQGPAGTTGICEWEEAADQL
jgi:hypothetical protein